MSMPNIPDITPDIILDREDVVHLLLTSIAMEEISFSHILNAEAEKIQHFLKDEHLSLCDALTINNSVEQMMRGVMTNQILLLHKLGDVMKLANNVDPRNSMANCCDDPACQGRSNKKCTNRPCSCNEHYEEGE
ncbi:hypothetical protein ACFSTH_08050 [Paenibacillus yanchengensis]|uniref:Uncharacterized protein n=1 Tax=Paenibacillus yanchengensis TaxID=2035833 RepID=A0ABW4YL80_9BACL